MRLFTAIAIPWQIRRNLELLVKHLKPQARISWSPLSNLHVTTKFIGEWPPDRIADLKSTLAEVPRPGPLKISIRGLGWFPHEMSPRVFYAGIVAPPDLAALASATDSVCERLGIPPETRDYRPHLTLARVRTPQPLFELKRAVAALPSDEFGSFEATEFQLYKSELQPQGSIYTKLETYSLLP